MYNGKTVAVVVVAYNEEGFVGEVIDTVPSFVDRVYAIDDCSTDGTWAEINRHAAEINEGRIAAVADGGATFDPRVVTIRHDENRGVGGAIKTGYLHAREDDIDVTVTMAGDGQMDPNKMDRIVEPVVSGIADYAKGNRLSRSEHRRDMPPWRVFGNLLLTLLARIASGYWGMMDPANGYTAISGHALDTLDIESIYEDYGAAFDILVRLNEHEFRLADVPMPANYGDERSDIRYTTFVPGLSMLFVRRFVRRLTTRYAVGGFHPLVIFYGLGAAGSVVGLVELVRGVVGRNDDSWLTGLGILTVSFVSLVLAMVFDRNENEGLDTLFE